MRLDSKLLDTASAAPLGVRVAKMLVLLRVGAVVLALWFTLHALCQPALLGIVFVQLSSHAIPTRLVCHLLILLLTVVAAALIDLLVAALLLTIMLLLDELLLTPAPPLSLVCLCFSAPQVHLQLGALVLLLLVNAETRSSCSVLLSEVSPPPSCRLLSRGPDVSHAVEAIVVSLALLAGLLQTPSGQGSAPVATSPNPHTVAEVSLPFLASPLNPCPS
jgi:hypothetical protein